jgi:hypothetical protein
VAAVAGGAVIRPVAAGAVIQVAAVGVVAAIRPVAAALFTPPVERPTSAALLRHRMLPRLQQAADFTLAPRLLRISPALRPAEDFMRAAARQFSLA